MKLTVLQIESIIVHLSSALAYAKEARHEAKKVYDHSAEVRLHLSSASEEIHLALRVMRGDS